MITEFSGNAQAMSLVGFSAVTAITLLLCVMTGPDRDDLDEFYTVYRSLSPLRNGLAIAVDYISPATVLRTAYRWQRRVATLTALGYFVLFLVLSAFAPSLMTSRVGAGLPLGLVLALVQLPVTWLAIAVYEHTARRYVDPLADRIRKQSEVDARREAGAR